MWVITPQNSWGFGNEASEMQIHFSMDICVQYLIIKINKWYI